MLFLKPRAGCINDLNPLKKKNLHEIAIKDKSNLKMTNKKCIIFINVFQNMNKINTSKQNLGNLFLIEIKHIPFISTKISIIALTLIWLGVH